MEPFLSVLFRSAGDRVPDMIAAPDFFVDLNLDQIITAVTASRDEYDLKPFFYWPLRDEDTIAFRHEVMRDVEKPRVFELVGSFAASMRTMREHLGQADKLRYPLQKQRWFLDAVHIYCDAVNNLLDALSSAAIESRGLTAFKDYLTRYVASEAFTSLRDAAKRLVDELAHIQYSVIINGLTVQVRHYSGEPDYSAEVEATFEKFKQGAVETYSFRFRNWPEMNHVEAQIFDLVAKLHPEVFFALESFRESNKDYQNPTIATFDREIQFYVAYIAHIETLKKAGLPFCYPRVSGTSKEVYSDQSFDLALAHKLTRDGKATVCNDFHLRGRERIIVVSGPNQGGKTTFARAFGQLHYFANLGCPVPGARAQVFLFDRLFAHFEREENAANLRGKLQDDLIRLHRILEQATPNSIVVMNEIFTSTTLRDALALSKRIAARIMALDLLGVWVTFIDELASLGEQTVSMVSTVVPENPAQRTFKIVRRPADGLAYAMSIAEKYRLTEAMIRERIGA
ncbi:MAG: MutS-related protein [Stellaceae bacterium]